MVQATIGLSYAALVTSGEAQAKIKALRAQLHAIGPDYDDRRVAAFGGLLALGRIDVFAGAREGSKNEPLEINLVGQIKNYAPVLELTAERWEELEAAAEESPVSRLSRWNDNPAAFWRSFSPYLSRSSRLSTRFLEYCEDESVVLEAPGLMALSRLRPRSSLLLDCCKRVLTAEFDEQKPTPFDAARTVVAASKCLATHFSEDSSAFAAIITASDSLRAQGGALVGLASHRPNNEVVVREYRKLLEGHRRPGLLVCAQLWLLSAQGTREQVATALARFVTRPAPSPWDFPEDALDAFRARLERDPKAEETLSQLAMDNDEPSVRASTVRLLASMSTRQSQDLAEELLTAESRRSGPPRFALDILTNRIRPARDLMREVLKKSNGQVGTVQEERASVLTGETPPAYFARYRAGARKTGRESARSSRPSCRTPLRSTRSRWETSWPWNSSRIGGGWSGSSSKRSACRTARCGHWACWWRCSSGLPRPCS